MLDLLIMGGKVLDFEQGLQSINLGIKDGKIAYQGEEVPPTKETLLLQGEIISPGFIDIHMHEEDFELSKGEFDISLTMLAMGVTTAVAGNCGNNRQSMAEFITHIDKKGSPINYMSYIGHNFLREQVGNSDTKAESSQEQIEKMKILVKEALDQGAVGLSYGFEYATGGTLEEAVAIAEPLWGRKDLLLAAHYRFDGERAMESVEEMAKISKRTGIPFLISHLSSCSAFGNMEEVLGRIHELKDEGVELLVDAYPYTAFSTYIGSDVFEDGCLERWSVDYDAIQLTEAPYENVRCTEEIFYDARKNYPRMLAIAFVMREEEIAMALADPMVMVASDGIYREHKGHPRGAGTFPRFISRYLRDEKIMDFVEGMKKITLDPARALGLENKGSLQLGKDADLCIFNLEEIQDCADFQDGQRPPKGIVHVLLEGKFALKDEKIIRKDVGKFIRK